MSIKIKNPDYVVPSGYTQLEYIESSGTQCILLGEYEADTVKMVIDSSFTNTTGGRHGNVSLPRCYFGIVSGQWAVGYNSTYDHSLGTADTDRHIFTRSSTQFMIDDTVLKSYTSSAPTTVPLYLLAATDSGNPQYKVSGKVYSCQIYGDGTNLSFNGVPAKNSSDVVGMYDTVTDTFFTNSGTGTFTAGPEVETCKELKELYKKSSSGTYDYIGEAYKKNSQIVVPSTYTQLEYVKSTGEQYISISDFSIQSGDSVSVKYCVDELTDYGGIVSSGTTFVYRLLYQSATLRLTGCSYNSASTDTPSSVTVGTTYDVILDSAVTNSGLEVFGYQNEQYLLNGKIYSVSVVRSGSVILNLVPAKNSSSVVGMYDIISNTFYPSATSTAFTAGPEVSPYEHIFSAGYDTTVTGNPLTMSNARAESLTYMLSGNSKRTIDIDGTEYDVPDGYTMLDSLQFTATSYIAGTYINTGITPNNATKVEIKANWTYTTGSNPTLYGARTNGTYYELLTSQSITYGFYQYGEQSRPLNLNSYLGTDTVYLTDNVSVYANGTLLDTASTATFTITNPIYLGCLNETGTANRFTNAKVFYCKIYQDGNTLSFAGIPAKNSSDVLGMYDFVTNTFFTNAGTGTFTAGNECPTPDGQLGVCGVGDYDSATQSYKYNLLHAQNCGMVDLGTLSWTYGGSSYNMMWATVPDKALSVTNQYLYGYTQGRSWSTLNDMEISGISVYNRIYIRNDSYGTDTSVFKSLMSGKYLFYQRITDDTWTAPTTYTIYDDSQLMKVGTYADTIESGGTRTNNIKKVTLSAGTSTISDAMTNSPYICTQQVDGTLSGQSITLDTGVANADVYYVLATATEDSITTPSISTVVGTNYLESTTTLPASELSVTYRKKTK